MRYLIAVVGVILFSTAVAAQMISGNSIGNDPTKEKLCTLRAKSWGTVETVPFEIDSGYLARERKDHPDATFLVVGSTLVECFLRSGTGRFEPDNGSGENWFWHLIKPPQYQPGYFTNEGERVALDACLKSASDKTKRPDFDHSIHFAPLEVGAGSAGGLYHAGVVIGGKKAQHYDIVLNGTLFFKSNGPDLRATKFICLLSPMLEFKAIAFK